MTKRNKARKKRPVSKPEKKRKRLIWLLYGLLIPAGVGLVFSIFPWRPKNKGPQFQKEGSLEFIRQSDERILKTIDIEVAKNDLEIQQGLMWRRSMEADQGMLFLTPSEEPQSFWMLNTYLSLDIIFVNEAMKIVKIQPNTEPQSLKSIPSERPAKYIVEVLAGFCVEHGITEGDKVRFEFVSKF